MSKTSPTQRALAECKKRGWTPAVVEKRVPFRNITESTLALLSAPLSPEAIQAIAEESES